MIMKYNDFDIFNDILKVSDAVLSTREQPGMANILERNGGYEVQLMVPGFSKEDLKISAQSGTLSISGERKTSNEKYVWKEYSPRDVKRKFTLPKDADLEAISARCDNGVLTVVVPVKAKEQLKQLEVTIN
jgi:HSP20 family protein